MRKAVMPPRAQECFRRATDARHMADAAENPNEKADLLEVEQGWLAIGRIIALSNGPRASLKKAGTVNSAGGQILRS
jgi:hypothetical protein